MDLRVLGSHGGESPKHRPTCFLIDGTLAIDAGGLTGGLPLREQAGVRAVLVSHCHLDHVRDLATLADNVVGVVHQPIEIVAPRATLAALRQHFFNDVIWPDFTRIPTARTPVYRLRAIRPGPPVRVGRYQVRAVPVNHPVPAHAYIVNGAGGGAVAFSGDTGPTRRLWKELARERKLRALAIECSFPNRMQALADVTGHLTPRTLSEQIAQLRADVPVLLYHLKPVYMPELVREVRALGDERVRVLQLGDRFRF